jgi:hypothetical protein
VEETKPKSPPPAQPQQDAASPANEGGNALPQASRPASANGGEEGRKDESVDGGGGDELLAEAARESPQPDQALGSWAGFGSTSEGPRATSPAMPIENGATAVAALQRSSLPRPKVGHESPPQHSEARASSSVALSKPLSPDSEQVVCREGKVYARERMGVTQGGLYIHTKRHSLKHDQCHPSQPGNTYNSFCDLACSNMSVSFI